MTRGMPVLGFVPALAIAGVATAGSHTWDLVEVFSNSDGTIQFMELRECCGLPNEVNLAGKDITSNATGNQFVFPSNLPAGETANKTILLATSGFAALPGAPAPDHIIQDNFFDTTADHLEYFIYDDLIFSAGELPLNGKDSLNRVGGDLVVQLNSPTNCAGESGTVDACPADLDGSGDVGVPDFLDLLAQWGTNPGGPPDLDGDGTVGVPDFLDLLAQWGPC